ncbi:MAG: BamA/TamA family outer membrane protein [Candidatus Eisenbacteria bacterium]
MHGERWNRMIDGYGRKTRFVVAMVLGFAVASAAMADERPFVLEGLEITGNTRTPERVAWLYLGLNPGAEVTAGGLVVAVDELRREGPFESVEFWSSPGSEKGRIVLHLDVVEKGFQFRFGMGFQDLSGWYMIPAELRYDNRFGRGEHLRFQVRLGYRTGGGWFVYEEPRAGDGRTWWGLRLGGEGVSRAYLWNGVEYNHLVNRGGLEAHVGRRFTRHLSLEWGGTIEAVEVDSTAEAAVDDKVRGVEWGDELPFEDLPPGVAAAVGEESRGTARFDVVWDSRSEGRLAGTPVGGLWGRLRTEGVFPDESDPYPRVTGDIRAYRSLFGAVFAARVRGGYAGWDAPFYDRHYVGGLYTVRGFAEQSLTRPAGDTRFWSASLEMRAPLAGGREAPRVTGILFVEAANSWTDDDEPTWGSVAAAAGYGIRIRLPWVQWLGFDVGIPITDSPENEAFHANGTMGMTF